MKTDIQEFINGFNDGIVCQHTDDLPYRRETNVLEMKIMLEFCNDTTGKSKDRGYVLMIASLLERIEKLEAKMDQT